MNVLLVGPMWGNATHGAEPGVYDALCELGHSVSVWDYRVKRYRIGEGEIDIPVEGYDHVDNEIIEDIEDIDITLCLGAGLQQEQRNSALWLLTSHTLRVLWNSEPIRLGNYKGRILDNKDEFQVFCTFDETEIPLYKEIGIDAHFLPQAYNPKWYFPIRDANGKELPPSQRFPGHFVFIGSIGGKWENRIHFLNRVLKGGKERGWRLNTTTLFDAKKVNKAYNMHDAVLNLGLYCPESGPPENLIAFGLQQRIFEAIGSGKVCITQETETDMFEHSKNILYYNKDNLEEVLSFMLDRKYRKDIEANILAIRDKHTYKERMKKLMQLLGAK
jgi:hypothetical protein